MICKHVNLIGTKDPTIHLTHLVGREFVDNKELERDRVTTPNGNIRTLMHEQHDQKQKNNYI